MKLVSLILAIQLLSSSINICLGAIACENVMAMRCEQDIEGENQCYKTQDSDSHSNQHSPCKEECACCSVMQVVFMDSQDAAGISTLKVHQQKNWISNYHAGDFTHLVWHPPQLI